MFKEFREKGWKSHKDIFNVIIKGEENKVKRYKYD